MKRWEYQIEPLIGNLAALGAEGWEAICAVGDAVLLKRAIRDSLPAPMPFALPAPFPSPRRSIDPNTVPQAQRPEHWADRLIRLHPNPAARLLVEGEIVKHWDRINDGPKFAAFMVGVESALQNWCEYWRESGTKYAGKLQTWLSDEAWTKQPPTGPAKPNSQTPDEISSVLNRWAKGKFDDAD